MFERFTEKARRTIFFARYEASQYGSPFIDTEHLLLGLLREDRSLAAWFPGQTNVGPTIRAEIERRIPPRERISTSVEVPLTADCKKVLLLAMETAEKFGHRHVGTQHLLIGLLRVEDSLAAQILRARGVKPEPVQEQLPKGPDPIPAGSAIVGPVLALNSFLAGLKWLNSEDLMDFFAKHAEFIDASGKRWNREEMLKHFETLFVPYAKKNATYLIESTLAEKAELFVATVLWKNALLASLQRSWMQRMTVTLIPKGADWEILLVQVTPVRPS